MPFTPLVVCVDIGSTTAGNFGWWSSAGVGGTTPSGAAECVAAALNNKTAVALGFECPLFVPIAENEAALTSARPGEGNRPWSAAAGLGSMGVGIAQVPWLLGAVRSQLTEAGTAFLEWAAFRTAGSGLFVWEAFVSGNDKRTTHIADAEAAVQAFIAALPEPQSFGRIGHIPSVMSLIGAALVRTGWSSDVSLLETPALVIGPAKSGV